MSRTTRSRSFGSVMPVAVRPTAITRATSAACRHSRSTPWPTIPVAPKIIVFIGCTACTLYMSEDAAVPEAIAFHAFPLAGIDPMSASTARAFPRHTHEQYGIGVVDAGGHASWSGRGQVEAGPGAFISVNPGEVHDGRAIGGRPRTWRILYVEPAVLAALRIDVLDGAERSFTFAAPVFADRNLHRLFDAAFGWQAGP